MQVGVEFRRVLFRSEDELLAIAAAAESSSEHPLADAIVKTAFERNVVPPSVEAFEAAPGKGVVARIDGQEILVGNPTFVAERGVDLSSGAERIAALEEAGGTVITAARNGHALGVIALGRTLKPDAARTAAALRNARVPTALVPRDNERAAR